jgi:hypothetical protein
VTWLLRLYPPAWRRRYGREIAALLDGQPASFGTAVDLVAGAVDAWVNPQSSTTTSAAHSEGDAAMIARNLQLRCAGEGTPYTRADAVKAAAVTVGGTLLSMLVLTWAIRRYGPNDFLTAFMTVSWLFPFLWSQRYTELKGRSGRVQAVLIGGPAAIVLAIVVSATWINSR